MAFAAHGLQDLQLAFEGADVDRRTQRAEVMMVAGRR